MYNKPYGDRKPGGSRDGKSFGDRGRGFGGGGGSRFGGRGMTEMHPATCEQCGKRCEVPFRPNGKKPVYCSNCFVKDDSRGPRQDGPRPERSYSAPAPASDVSEQLKIINSKLDAIIAAMEE